MGLGATIPESQGGPEHQGFLLDHCPQCPSIFSQPQFPQDIPRTPPDPFTLAVWPDPPGEGPTALPGTCAMVRDGPRAGLPPLVLGLSCISASWSPSSLVRGRGGPAKESTIVLEGPWGSLPTPSPELSRCGPGPRGKQGSGQLCLQRAGKSAPMTWAGQVLPGSTLECGPSGPCEHRIQEELSWGCFSPWP